MAQAIPIQNAPAIPIQNGDGDGEVDNVSTAKLKSFTASPEQIGPFGASVLKWEVVPDEDADPGGLFARVQIKLNGLPVKKKDQRVVRPLASTNFTLSAHSGRASRSLGNKIVRVDLSKCETFPILNPQTLIKNALKVGINNTPNATLNGDPVVTFSLGQIKFFLSFDVAVNGAPDPTINVNASFRIGVENDRLVPFAVQVGVGVDFGFFGFVVPESEKERAREETRAAMIEAISLIVTELDLLSVGSNAQAIKHDVKIGVSETGAGTLDVTECPNDLLRNLADISGVVVATKG